MPKKTTTKRKSINVKKPAARNARVKKAAPKRVAKKTAAKRATKKTAK